MLMVGVRLVIRMIRAASEWVIGDMVSLLYFNSSVSDQAMSCALEGECIHPGTVISPSYERRVKRHDPEMTGLKQGICQNCVQTRTQHSNW